MPSSGGAAGKQLQEMSAANCGNTPLHVAAKNGNVEIFKSIASSIKNINPKNDENEMSDRLRYNINYM